MTFDLAQMIAALQDRTMSWVGDGSQSDPLCTQAAAEIIRLTARVERLEGALSEFRSAAMWTKHAAEVLDGYEADYGEFLPLIYEIGRIPDSRKTASFRIYPNHIRGLADLLKPSAALSTPTEETKT